jgi:hypothetical protein
MIIIIPCCGESQRFNGTKKQFLKLPNGLPLPVFSASGMMGPDRMVYTFIKEEFIEQKNGDLMNLLWRGDLCLLQNKTSSQVETVAQTIVNLCLQKSQIYIKDCDNYFQATALPNRVTVRSINNADFKLHNKSFTAYESDSGIITRIEERNQISYYINVGGYGFESGQLFLDFAAHNTHISQVISSAMRAGVVFKVNHCKRYIDYGEQDDYNKFIKETF